MKNKLNLDQSIIARCRQHAAAIARQVQEFIDRHTTVSVERSVLRLLGVDGIDSFDVPLPNLMVDEIRRQGDLSLGIARPLAAALQATGMDVAAFCSAYARGEVKLAGHALLSAEESRQVLQPYLQATFERIRQNRFHREEALAKEGDRQPEIYVIVATGNIYEDVKQAQAAAHAGADVIAVIRSTGQSLLDYVPYGATTEGFGGTMATQENFRIMRKALDEKSAELKRYIKLVNYASGLCMPEIAAMGALERLDMMLNDSMYGIIFRDINMQRTFVDQYFSRSLNAVAGITINT
ncbi:MAG: D-lysine 5,6-aminomutase subunit alpha, partial [Clostridiales bacterium]|nr:D-lysine 5,6-aminomutase subunit alpha [Clostridiales bacterium]